MVSDQADIEVVLLQPLHACAFDFVLDASNTAGINLGETHVAFESGAALATHGLGAFAERSILAEADRAWGGLRVELLQVDASLGDIFHDVVEVVVLDGFDSLQGMIRDPAEAAVDLEVAVGGSERDGRELEHLEVLPVNAVFGQNGWSR